MKVEAKKRGMLARKLENPEFAEQFEEGFDAFELEVQILNALEAKEWSYSKLADAVKTSKSNISRDLNGGGLLSATISRVRRIADALGMKLVMFLIPKEQAHFIVPKLQDIARSSFNAAHGGFPVAPLSLAPGMIGNTNAALYFTASRSESKASIRLGLGEESIR